MTKQFFLRLVMAFGLMFGLHFSTPALARVEGGEEPPIKLIRESWRSASCYYDCLGTRFDANIATTQNKPVYDVSVKASLFDGKGNLLETGVFTAALPATLPGQFNMIGGAFGTTYSESYTTELTINSYSLTSSIGYKNVEVIFTPPESDNYSEFPRNYAKGFIFNPYPVSLKEIKVYFYQTNCFSYAGIVSFHQTLPPGGHIAFDSPGCISGGGDYHDALFVMGQAQVAPDSTANPCFLSYCLYFPIFSRKDTQPKDTQPSAFTHFWKWRDPQTGKFEFVGDVETGGATPLYNAQIRASAFGVSGTLLATKIFTTEFPATLEGQFNLVRGQFDLPFESVSDVKADVLSYDTSSPTNYVNVFAFFRIYYQQAGYIYNPYDKPLSNVKIACRGWHVLYPFGPDLDYYVVTNTIQPGEMITFTSSSMPYPSFIAGQGQLEP